MIWFESVRPALINPVRHQTADLNDHFLLAGGSAMVNQTVLMTLSSASMLRHVCWDLRIGIERFKEWFRRCVDHYALIGGTACALLMAKVADSAVVWDDLQKFLASMQGEQVDTKEHIP
jgi:hypothetical protein